MKDLVNVAQIGGKLSRVADYVYRRKYSNSRVVVTDKYYVSIELEKLLTGAEINTETFERINRDPSHVPDQFKQIIAYGDYIELGYYDGIVNTFMHFGHLIKKVIYKTEEWAKPSQTEIIGYFINKYGSESLTTIDFEHSPDKLLKYITEPLISVEHVILKHCHRGYDNPITQFCERFPSLRRLDMGYLSEHDLASFDCYMPNLEHFSMLRSYNDEDCPLPGIIKTNPQIRSVHLAHVQPEFVQNLTIALPNLETLELSEFECRCNLSIQFENVTTFIYGFGILPSCLHFPRLKSLRFEYVHHQPTFNYLPFLNGHRHLKHVHMKGNVFGNTAFQQLTANLTDLVEISVLNTGVSYPPPHTECFVIEEFAKSHDKVMKITLIGFAKHCEVEFQEQLKNEWNIRTVSFDRSGLSFERKRLTKITPVLSIIT